MIFLIPFARTEACLFGKSLGERTARTEAAFYSYVLYLQFRLLGHEAFGFLDAVAIDELVERAAELITNETTEICAVHRQHVTQVHQLEVGIEVGLRLTHPAGETLSAFAVDSFAFIVLRTVKIFSRNR